MHRIATIFLIALLAIQASVAITLHDSTLTATGSNTTVTIGSVNVTADLVAIESTYIYFENVSVTYAGNTYTKVMLNFSTANISIDIYPSINESIGDNVTPIISSFDVLPKSFPGNQPAIVTTHCTDNIGVYTVLAEITDPQGVKANYTMTGTNGTYTYSYTPPLIGTYFARSFCTDQLGQTANTTSIPFTVSLAVVTGGGSGGGGGTTIIQQVSSFLIKRPVNGLLNPVCPAGQASPAMTFELYNDMSTDQAITTEFKGVNCSIDKASFTIPSKKSYIGTVDQCVCPVTDDQIKGWITFTSGTYSKDLPIVLYSNAYARLSNDPNYLLKALVLGAAAIVLIVIIIILAVAAGKRR